MTNTFRQYAELFLRTRPITPRTAQDYRILLSSVILPAWGDRDLTSIKASELRVWLTQLWQRAPHQARRSRVILRGIFELAEDDGIIDKNPTTRLRIRTPPRATPRVLTVDQINKLIDAMPTERDRLLTSVLAYGGLRYGEATALAPHDVAGIGLTVRRSVQPAHGGGWLWGDTKTHQKRHVPLPSKLLADLTRWAHSRRHHELLFASQAETPIYRGNWTSRILVRACDAAEIPRITPHDLRASCASMLAASGVPIAAAAQHLGHSDSSVTMRHYLAADTTASVLITEALTKAEQKGHDPAPNPARPNPSPQSHSAVLRRSEASTETDPRATARGSQGNDDSKSRRCTTPSGTTRADQGPHRPKRSSSMTTQPHTNTHSGPCGDRTRDLRIKSP